MTKNVDKYMYMYYVLVMTANHRQRDVLRVYPYLKTRTLYGWINQGLIRPEVYPGGSGNQRLYSWRNLVELGIIRELKEVGVHNYIVFNYLEISEKLDVDNDTNWILVGRKAHVDKPGAYNHDVLALRPDEITTERLLRGSSPDSKIPGIFSISFIMLDEIADYLLINL